MVTIWDKLLFKIRVSFDGLVIRKNVFSESIHCIETHIDVVVEALEVRGGVAFRFFLDEEFI